MVIGLLWAALTLAPAPPPTASCVLPVADGDVKSPSQPNIEGTITAAKGPLVEVDSTGKVRHPVLLDERTRMFTVHGGFVGVDELVPGQVVRIWLANCKAAKPGARGRVAVLVLASKKPGQGWP